VRATHSWNKWISEYQTHSCRVPGPQARLKNGRHPTQQVALLSTRGNHRVGAHYTRRSNDELYSRLLRRIGVCQIGPYRDDWRDWTRMIWSGCVCRHDCGFGRLGSGFFIDLINSLISLPCFIQYAMESLFPSPDTYNGSSTFIHNLFIASPENILLKESNVV
jgi:hypothetical protein